MATGDDFWLLLHDMANAVDSDHTPFQEKAQVLAGYFRLYPPVARKQIADEFRLVLGVLIELDPLVQVANADGKATIDSAR